MAQFKITGYYKDDKSEFDGYLVTSFDSSQVDEDQDDEIFYYGLSEQAIKDAIANPEQEDILDFVITGYEPVATDAEALEEAEAALTALQAEFDQYKRESVKWCAADFTGQQKEGYRISEEQAQEALEQMIRKHDAEIGITWDTVDYYLQEYGTRTQKGFIVLENMASGFEPVFKDSEDALDFYIYKRDAEQEINECINDISEAIKEGNMDEGSRMTSDDFMTLEAVLIGADKDEEEQQVEYVLDGVTHVIDRIEKQVV